MFKGDKVDFEEFLKSFGFTTTNSNSNIGGCNDIPGGFQDINPEVFALIGELVGNIMAGNLPFNVQNAIGNWLQLVGQAILVYNAQQQYFQGGPGRYYNIKNKNVTNPFCTSNNNGNSSNTMNYEEEINALKEDMKKILKELKELKENID